MAVLQGVLIVGTTPIRIIDIPGVSDSPIHDISLFLLPSDPGIVYFAPRSDVGNNPAIDPPSPNGVGHPITPGAFWTVRPENLGDLYFVADAAGRKARWLADTRES